MWNRFVFHLISLILPIRHEYFEDNSAGQLTHVRYHRIYITIGGSRCFSEWKSFLMKMIKDESIFPFSSLLICFAALGLLTGFTGHPAAQPCVVCGEHVSIRHVTVSPCDSHSFEIGFRDAKVEASVPLSGAISKIKVHGTLSFEARVKQLWYRIKTPVIAEHGMVSLHPGAFLVDVKCRGDKVVASAGLYMKDIEQGAEEEVTWEKVSTVEIPSAALALDYVGKGVGSDSSNYVFNRDSFDDVHGDGTRWETPFSSNGTEIKLYAEPGHGAPSISIVSQSGSLEFHHVSDRGLWMRVMRTGDFAFACVIGWVLRSTFKRVPQHRGVAYYPPDCCGPGSGYYGQSNPPLSEIAYKGPAFITAGTKVYWGCCEKPWATAIKEDTCWVTILKGRDSAELDAVAGISLMQQDIVRSPFTVPVSGVKIPTFVREKAAAAGAPLY